MNVKDDFTTVSLKLLVSVISLVVIFPLVDKTSEISLYITVIIFVLGKFVELIGKVPKRHLPLFLIIYIIGIFTGIFSVGMCFYGLANLQETTGLCLPFNYILVSLAAFYSFIDLAEFIYCLVRIIYTKKLLNHFS